MLITLIENPVDACGIPSFLVVPLILTHHSRRFSMRVTVKATFGFWCGKMAESILISGLTDDPLYFDPAVLNEFINKKETGIGGGRIAEWEENLEQVNLKDHSSL